MSNDHDSSINESVGNRAEAAAAEGCPEARLLLSRRAMLGLSAMFCAWTFQPHSATSATLAGKRLLVVVLRGGLDGLHVLVPYDEKDHLIARRNRIYSANYFSNYTNLGDGKTKDSSIQGSGSYLLTPSMPKFSALYRKGVASIIHSIAPPVRTQSHFDCQDSLENGYPSNNRQTQDGWLNRFLQRLPTDTDATNRIGLSTAISLGNTPLMLRGAASVSSWCPCELVPFSAAFINGVRDRYRQRATNDPKGLDAKLYNLLNTGLAADRAAGRADGANKIVRSFAGAGAFMSAADGPRIGVLSVDGMDTHKNEITTLALKLAALDDGLDAFRTAMGPAWNSTVVVFVTEFGRTISDNAYGTDHGTGTVALLAGGAVNGGKIIKDVSGSDRPLTIPGVASTTTPDAGIAARIDTRALFKGLLIDHLDCRNDGILESQVFPDSSGIAPLTGLVSSSPANSPPLTSLELTNADYTKPTISSYRAVHGA